MAASKEVWAPADKANEAATIDIINLFDFITLSFNGFKLSGYSTLLTVSVLYLRELLPAAPRELLPELERDTELPELLLDPELRLELLLGLLTLRLELLLGLLTLRLELLLELLTLLLELLLGLLTLRLVLVLLGRS